MASYTVAANEHAVHAKTLTATTVDTVTFTGRDLESVEIISNGTADIYVTVDGTTPTVAGNNTFRLPTGGASVRELAVRTSGQTVVKLISSGTPQYSVSEVA